MISSADNGWPLVVRNLSRARAVWDRITRIISREGAELRVSGFFFKAMVQAVLIFGSETWTVTPRMGRDLGGFQDQVARRLTDLIPQQKTDEKREYNLVAAAREEAGFQTTEEYIRQQNNMVT